MGTWGSSLYANDTTSDVRDTYKKLLEEQYTDEEAYQKTLDTYWNDLTNEEVPLFWYALADTQWRLGRLMPEVKENALKWIEKEGGIELWMESANKGAGWRKTLLKLKEKLETTMPSRVIIKKPVEFIRNPWEAGDVYVYQFHTEKARENGLYGKYIPFQKVGNTTWCDGWRLSVIQVYDCVFDTIPDMNEIKDKRILPLCPPPGVNGTPDRIEDFIPSFERSLKAYMIYDKKRDYPNKYLTFIGRESLENKEYEANEIDDYYWKRNGMENWLVSFFIWWQDVEY